MKSNRNAKAHMSVYKNKTKEAPSAPVHAAHNRPAPLHYLLVILISSAAAFFAYRLWRINLFETPIDYYNDALPGLVNIRLMMENGGLGYTSDRLGAPFGYATFDFLQNDYIPQLLTKLLTLFTSNWILVFNLTNLLSFPIVACVALCVLRKLDVEPRVAVVMAVLFSCSPFHYYRAFRHGSFALCVSIPVAVYYILRLMRGEAILEAKNHYLNRNNFGYVLAMILLGVCGVYYAFFTCFFLCVAGVYILIREKKLSRLKETVLSIVLIVCTTVIGYLPTILYRMKNGANTAVAVRTAAESELYSLKLSQLLLPVSNHCISFLASLKDFFNTSFSVNGNENDSVTLGLIFAVGFLLLLLSFFRKRSKVSSEVCYIQELACLNLSALLYASSGGLILVQALFFTQIRCGNRISVFISFFSCVCVGLLLSRLLKQKKVSRVPSGMISLGLAVLLAVGILDQTATGLARDYEEISSQVQSDRAFVEAIEDMEEEGSMILQLPIVRYPEAGTVNEMKDYSHFVGFLYSDTLRWSYGVMYGRDGYDVLDDLKAEDLTAEELVLTAASMGYTGIYIDEDGYTEEELILLEEGLEELLDEAPLVSEKEDKLYFSLTAYISQNEIGTDYLSLIYTDGIYGEEGSGDSSWNWMEEEGTIRIYNWSDQERHITLTLTISSPWEGEYSFLLTDGETGEESEYMITQGENSCELDITLEPGYNTLPFATDAPAVETQSDPRNMHLMLTGAWME
ncbi:MAG: hypothetical protein LUG56_08745 [Lachnospiraceae bacterium]|nr:hypothetical protein [Lachnospiraceae bacterium]